MNIILFIIISFLFFEFLHYSRKISPLNLEPSNWKVISEQGKTIVNGKIKITNPHKRMEVMVPKFELKPLLIGNGRYQNVTIETNLKLSGQGTNTNYTNYWQANIVKSKSASVIDVGIILVDNSNELSGLCNIWMEVNWINYGPFGQIIRKDGFNIPIKYPEKLTHNNANFKNSTYFSTLPIKTHVLGVLDDPYKLIKNYTTNIIMPGDIITIGETPLSIMQGRYHHPNNINTTLLSRSLCYFFHPTSSLATACGMQSLINEVGPSRVIIAWIIGSAFKLIRVKGMFYRLAGEQARLVDDITGTTPPYDQSIVMGPKDPYAFCKYLYQETGLNIAIVDVNDLGKVKILASSKNADRSLIKKALKSNPAGNADEQTPLVLIRPLK
ncbi:F420-0:Gamma-glutamyl ligase [Prochlorococcus marinus]|uniref:F420-0:Gamma-glutamyl ligase n=1 Tax=Prochlorococcus marinus TaxID=1219 RepID=UPI0022B2AFBA|nr:F420-0:Gamma-glutamyl ligase [Prochlorococcus marinus]